MANSREFAAGFAEPLAANPLIAEVPHARPDGWTLVSTVISGLVSFVSSSFWIGNIIDSIGNLDDVGIGLSWWGIGFGAGTSLVIAGGAAYAQGVQNIQFQEEPRRGMINATRVITSEVLQRLSHHESQGNSELEDRDHDPAPRENDALIPRAAPVKLSLLQKTAVVCYSISYIGDIAGVLTAVIRIATGDNIPVYGEVLVQAGSISTGALASVADVRTIYKNMTLFAERRAERRQEMPIVAVENSGPSVN